MKAKKLAVIVSVALLITLLSSQNSNSAREAGLELVGGGDEVKSEVSIQSHFYPFIPSCVYPTHSAAFAVFTTGPGPVEIQFHGTDV